MAFDGTCLANETKLHWRKPWKKCTYNTRRRVADSYTCQRDITRTEAPWLKCTREPAGGEPVDARIETCNKDGARDLDCVDINSSYDSDTGFCQCNEELVDSGDGCVTIAENGTIISSVVGEISQRFKKSGVTKSGVFKLLNRLETVSTKKFNNRCGALSRLFSPAFATGKKYNYIQKYLIYFIGLNSLHVELDRITAISDDDSKTALADAIKLFNQVLKLTIWNCPNSGYGWDTSDITDENGQECPSKNENEFGQIQHMQYMKCRVQFRLHRAYTQTLQIETDINPENKLFDVSLVKPTKNPNST